MLFMALALTGCGAEPTETSGSEERSADSSSTTSGDGGLGFGTLTFPDPTVAYLQQALHELGYPVGTIDGFYGENTTEALAEFQSDNGLESTGHLDTDTIEAIEAQNDSTEHLLVEAIQTQLAELGLYPGPIDGLWGSGTESAVSMFQEQSSLETTGHLDEATFGLLVAAYDRDVIAGHREAAQISGVGGEVHDTQPTVPEAAGDDYLQQGDDSPEVQRVQERLAELGYRPGTADGNYGAQTASAVLAFQKREGLQRDGIIGPEVMDRLSDPQGAGPRSDAVGPRVEVDLDRQILFVVDADGFVYTINTSTGSGKEFQSAEPGKGIVVAHTPVGEFEILRVIDGNREAPLGTLYRPMYFTNEGGFAIHGNPHVPAYPASHGCARTANWDMDFLWDLGLGVGNPVWVYGDNPPAPENAAGGF